MAEIKIGGKTRFENLLQQLFHSPYAPAGYFISSYPTRAHGIIVIQCLVILVSWTVVVIILDAILNFFIIREMKEGIIKQNRDLFVPEIRIYRTDCLFHINIAITA